MSNRPITTLFMLESLDGKISSGYKILYAHNGKLPEYLIFVGGLLYDKK